MLFSDRASWIDYTLITNLMHNIHKILYSSTCFELQVLIFRRIQLYTCSIWYCHSLQEFMVASRYTAWVTSHSLVLSGKLWEMFLAFVEAFLIQMLTVCSLFLHNLVRNFFDRLFHWNNRHLEEVITVSLTNQYFTSGGNYNSLILANRFAGALWNSAVPTSGTGGPQIPRPLFRRWTIERNAH